MKNASDYQLGELAAAADIAAGNGPAIVGRSNDSAYRSGRARLSDGSDFDIGYLSEGRRRGVIR